MRFLLQSVSLSLPLNLSIMATETKLNWLKITLECIKLICTAILGYIGGNAFL